MSFLLYINIIIIAIVFIKHDILYKSQNNNIKVVDSVITPTIINEQIYYYHKVNFNNYSYFQLLRSDDYISNEIKRLGKWPECEEMYSIYMSGKKNGVFIDFGANIGSCSFLFALAGVKVYAFEPLPNNLFPFTTTLFGNSKFKKYITLYPYALGNEEKKQIMKITKKNWSFSSIYYNHTDFIQEIIVKRLDSFDNLIPGNVGLIKIDVEAAEYDLIEGGKKFFKNHQSEYIHMEVACGKKDIYGKYEIEKMFKILDKMGYNILKKYNCKKTEKSNIVAVSKSISFQNEYK